MKESIPKRAPENFADYFALVVTTFGVGYLPLAPGTWGSMVGVGIFLIVRQVESEIYNKLVLNGVSDAPIFAAVHALNLIVFLLFSLLGIWAAGRATEIFGSKDPSQAVVDEIIGQLAVFFCVPFNVSWKFVLAGFLLFRLFDIWKPYPIKSLEKLPGGLGICADDVLAGIYGGAVLSLIYAVRLSF